MSTASTVAAEPLLTAEEFARRPDPGHPEELVEGRGIALPQPNRRHGQICSRTDRIIGNFVDEHDLGHVLCNDAGVITQRDPDTVRGADVAYYSYQRLPKGALPASYGPEVPELGRYFVDKVVLREDEMDEFLTFYSRKGELYQCTRL